MNKKIVITLTNYLFALLAIIILFIILASVKIILISDNY